MASTLPSRPRQSGNASTIAIVSSTYHDEFVKGLISHARAELTAIDPDTETRVLEVPGSFEIPLAVAQVARQADVDAVIAFGVLIEGETEHAAMVARTVTDALMRIMLSSGTPVIHEVLLLKSEEQARARCLEDQINRGTEAARVAMHMIQTMSHFPRG
ncbi:MAG: 6,7-dimethyl-8-ribityllumazine synthase [Chthoniobacteraceae bacterium]